MLTTDTTDNLRNVPSTVIEMLPCAITGNHKPGNSPQYEEFEMGQYQNKVAEAKQNDLVWLLSRYFQRLKPPEAVRAIPSWSAYNPLICDSTNENEHHLDQSHALPVINAPAHEWRTLVTTLERLSQLNSFVCPQDPGKVIVTMDMDLYKRAVKLEYLDEQYSGKWLLCPGAFHMVLCSLRCLGKTVEHSGLDQAWSKDLYSTVTVSQIINGNHHNRAIEAHELILEVFFQLWFKSFLEEKPAVFEALMGSLERLALACE